VVPAGLDGGRGTAEAPAPAPARPPRPASSRGTSSSRLASGRQPKRTGAYGDVPSLAATCSRRWEPQREAPRARERSTPQLVTRFAEARTREYQELIRQLQEFSSLPLQKQAVGRLSRLRSRFQEIVEVDFFASPLQKRVAELLARADAARVATRAPVFAAIRPRDYKGRVWVTRPRPGVDRSASAWLIRRFIDAKARFAFAPEDQVPREGVPFDMFHERGFGHRGDDCTFETLQKQFKIRDKRVSAISEIIHDADLADGMGVFAVLYGVPVWGFAVLWISLATALTVRTARRTDSAPRRGSRGPARPRRRPVGRTHCAGPRSRDRPVPPAG